jgi:hypothetical protein
VPRDAFIASAGDAGITFSASLGNGDPLPPWLTFDPKTDTFTGKPPAGFSGVFTLQVTVHDAAGHDATTSFHLSVGEGGHAALEAAPAATQAALAPRDPGLPDRSHLRLAADNDHRQEATASGWARHGLDGAPAGHDAGDGAAAGHGEAHPAGKPGLLAQLRAAGRHGFLSERQALLDSLHRRAAS